MELLDSARQGDGAHLLIEGEAGIGKSRLLRELVAIARRNGFRALTAQADPLATDVAFGVALELIEPLASARGAERTALFAGAARLALPLLSPELPARDDAAAERFAHGTFRLLANAAERAPLLVAVDDVQWADRGSLRLLAHLAARLGEHRIALIATVRRGEPAVDPDGLERLRLEPPAAVLEPRPLPLDAVRRLAAEAGLATRAERLQAATGGNPLLLRALLAELAARDEEAGAEALGEDGVPQVARHVRAQLARLGPLPTQLAQAAAVLGDGASLRQAARLAGADLDSAAAAADRLLAGGILARVDPLAFEHPIVRSSLHDELAPAARARLHAAAARQLAADRVDSERLAAHVVRALPAGEPQAVELLQAAARQARGRAVPESAVRYLRRALEEPPADWQLPGLLLELGRAEAAAGLPEAAATLARALELLSAPRERAEALLWSGRARLAGGLLLDAAAAFDQGLAELGARDGGPLPDEPAPDAALRELATELRAGFISAARFETSLRPEAQRRLQPLLAAPADGTTRGERALLAEVALEQGIRGAPPAVAIATAMRAWAGGQVLDELDAQGIVLSQIAATLTWSDALAESRLVLDAAVEHAERNGATAQLATATYLRAWPSYYEGELAAAERDAELALATPGWKMYEPSARAVIALVALERGDGAAAERALDVPDAAERWAGSIPYAMLLEAEGRLLLLRGDAAGALRAFEACGALISSMETGHPFCPWRSLAALAHLRLGAHERAAGLAAEELSLARDHELARPLGGALRVAALTVEGEARLRLLREAVAVLTPSPARLERLRALVALGGELRRSGDAQAARQPLREALALAEETGATVLGEQARTELIAAGARPRRAATSGAAALTPSELRIARLAALGLSNREIAHQAVVVQKTVQFHLSNAYRKLGVEGREELAAALAGVDAA